MIAIAVKGFSLGMKLRAMNAWNTLRAEQRTQLTAFADKIGMAELGRMATEAVALAKHTGRAALPQAIRSQIRREARRAGMELSDDHLQVVAGLLISISG